jgi:hypothetical protein
MPSLKTKSDIFWSNKFQQIFDQQKEMIRISGTWLESPFQMPVSVGVVFGMNQNSTNTGNIGGLECAQQSIFEQRAPKTVILMIHVDCQSRQDHYRHRVSSQTVNDSTCSR